MRHQLHPALYDDAVLVAQLHHVTDRGKRRKLQQLQSKLRLHHLLPPHPLLRRCQCQDELVRHHRAADSRKRIAAVLLFGIDDRPRLRHFVPPFPVGLVVGNLVVVCHDHSHSQRVRKRDLVVRRDAVVTGEHRVRTRIVCLLYQMFVQAVPVADPVRNRRIYPRAASRKPPVQNICGADPIDIIVPYDADMFSLRDLL